MELEKKIIALGIDPKDPTAMGELVKQKDNKIKVLKMRLNLLEAQHWQTAELQAIHEEKEQPYHQLVKSKKALTRLQIKNERLQVENETFINQQAQLIQTTNSKTEQATLTDTTKGLTK